MTRDWSRVDWGRQDVEIAAEMGVSREAARQRRPEGVVAARHRQRTVATAEARIEAMDTSAMTLDRVAALAGCSRKHALRVLSGLGKAYSRLPRGNARYDWGRFPADWMGMTDKQIAVVVGVGDPAVVTQWRNRHGYHRRGVGAVLARKAVAG